MNLRFYQWIEIFGILLLTGATAAQIFLLEPISRRDESNELFLLIRDLKSDINRNAKLISLDSPAAKAAYDKSKATEPKTSANLENFFEHLFLRDIEVTKETEASHRILVIALFVLGTFMVAVGRAWEMHAINRVASTEPT